jgi:hypothetical protein
VRFVILRVYSNSERAWTCAGIVESNLTIGQESQEKTLLETFGLLAGAAATVGSTKCLAGWHLLLSSHPAVINKQRHNNNGRFFVLITVFQSKELYDFLNSPVDVSTIDPIVTMAKLLLQRADYSMGR